MRKTITIYVVLIFILLNGILAFGQGKSQAFEISKNLDIYATLFKELNNNYVEEIKPGELNTVAIEAMLQTLDPYTVFIPESKVEDVKYLTTGEYGGIGVNIVKRDGEILIYMIMAESPAFLSGLLAGDIIISIDDQDLREKADDEISTLLKGQPGTSIRLLIKRTGIDDQFTKEVFRKKIDVDNIPYYGMLDSSIAYINLASFTKNAGKNVKKSFSELKENNPKGLIFDLRSNGGGLIGEAVEIMNVFVEKDQEVVRTKSRLRDKNFVYKTRNKALDTTIPIVFLVDRNTASASEILSGAAQDLDRAVIIGERTYGKGLVQNVLPLSFNSQFKVTIAKYYIPSGRCVQAIDYSHKDEDGNPVEVNDTLLEAFETKNGRIVYDGRGIKPDILMSPHEFSDLSKSLIKKFIIFDFSTQYKLENDSLISPDKFEVDDELWSSFLDFIKDKDITYESDLEQKLNIFKAQAQEEDIFEDFQAICEQIQQKIDDKKKNELDLYQEEIKRIIKTDLVSRYYFSKGVIIANLHQDKAIGKAMELLKNSDEYNSLLEGKN